MIANIGITIIGINEIEREGLRRLLNEQSFVVLGAYASQHDHLSDETLDHARLAVVIVYPNRDANFSQVCLNIRSHIPACKVVIMDYDCGCERVLDAINGGVDAYIDKRSSCEIVSDTLRLVAAGGKVMPAEVIENVANNYNWSGNTAASDRNKSGMDVATAMLTDREIGILQGLIRGEPNKIISRNLAIAEATVKIHVKSILRKSGRLNRTQAAVWGIDCGLKAVPS